MPKAMQQVKAACRGCGLGAGDSGGGCLAASLQPPPSPTAEVSTFRSLAGLPLGTGTQYVPLNSLSGPTPACLTQSSFSPGLPLPRVTLSSSLSFPLVPSLQHLLNLSALSATTASTIPSASPPNHSLLRGPRSPVPPLTSPFPHSGQGDLGKTQVSIA